MKKKLRLVESQPAKQPEVKNRQPEYGFTKLVGSVFFGTPFILAGGVAAYMFANADAVRTSAEKCGVVMREMVSGNREYQRDEFNPLRFVDDISTGHGTLDRVYRNGIMPESPTYTQEIFQEGTTKDAATGVSQSCIERRQIANSPVHSVIRCPGQRV